MKNLRHSSLQMNVIYEMAKLQSCGNDSKSEILVQKIKIEIFDSNLYFHEIKSDYIPVYTTE